MIKMSASRFAYIDNVRSLVIFLVLATHSAVTYSGFGDWYYMEGSPEKLSVFGTAFFGLIQSHMQAWTMGMLFFISAYLATKSLSKRGSFGFIKERLFRLGLPLLLYIFIVTPFIVFVILGNVPEPGDFSNKNFFENYSQFLINFWWLGSSGPLWFVQVLLIFCFIYVLVKKCFNKFITVKNISQISIVLMIFIIGICAFLVRLVFPIGTSFYNLQFCYFSSYTVMFIAGLLIGENNLLDELTDEKNIRWLKLSLVIGIPMWVLIMLFGGALEGKTYFNGGFCWQSFAFAFWEALTAVGFSTGLMALFKKRVNADNKITGLVRNNAFGIYFFHAPIMVIISLSLKNWVLNPIIKFLMVLFIAFITTLLFSYFIRKIKPMRILFK